MTPPRLACFALCALAILARPALAAITINGQLDPDYGAYLVVQTTQTDLSNGQIIGDNNQGDISLANGSELDRAYAVITGGVLYVFLAGNVACELNATENQTVGHYFDLFVDCLPGGQNQLNGLGAGHPLNGMSFDADFSADYMFELNHEASQHVAHWFGAYGNLLPPGPTLTSLGETVPGSGTFSGGTNPFGILGTIDNRNVAGVTFGCGQTITSTAVTSGVEWAIPLNAIGNPSGCFKIMALIRSKGTTTSVISNQTLGPLPPGTCSLGDASFVNFANLPNPQYFYVCTNPTGVGPSSAPRLALLGGPNPVRGDRLRVSFTMEGGASATLDLVDLAGRVVRSANIPAGAGGEGALELSGERLTSGVYWLRLSQGAAQVTRSLCVMR